MYENTGDKFKRGKEEHLVEQPVTPVPLRQKEDSGFEAGLGPHRKCLSIK